MVPVAKNPTLTVAVDRQLRMNALALAFGMFVVLALMMVIYIPLQRRAARWAK